MRPLQPVLTGRETQVGTVTAVKDRHEDTNDLAKSRKKDDE
jgi:hypothetical protein